MSQFSRQDQDPSGNFHHQFNGISSNTNSGINDGTGNNNNYVDFNQFIMQHNFGNPLNNSGGGAAGYHHQQQHPQQQIPNNYGYYSNQVPSTNYINDSNYYQSNTTQQSLIPPSSTINSLFYGTPNYDTTFSSTSNLIPTAAEFVPRFNTLTLNDESQKKSTSMPSSSSMTQLNMTNLSQQQNSNKKNQDYTNNVKSSRDSLIKPIYNSNSNLQQSTNKDNNYPSSSISRHSSNYSHSGGNGNSGNRLETENRRSQNNRNDNISTSSSSYRNQQQKYDNNRHNKRRDNWNRNRDRELLSDTNINSTSSNNSNSGKYDRRINDNDRRNNDNSIENNYHHQQQQQQQHYQKDSPKKLTPKSPQKQHQINYHSHHQQQQYNNSDNEKLPQREKLIKEIEARRLECPVCVETIKVHQPVWSCTNCYHIFHLNCIIKWASSSKSEDGWRCPACQNISKQIPRDYYCFCGKVRNPEFNRNDLAHSCGELCGRKDNCQHSCTLLCHPGPCPPCQALVTRECGCGKTSKSMQCHMKEEMECDLECGKILNCELHNCAQKCHHGKCPPCDNKIEQNCHCGKQDRQVACTRDSNDKKCYSCGKPCNKSLECGNHKCKDCCHFGDCKPCKLSPELITSCPCGKLQILKGERISCLDAVPVCSGTCGKTLKCGPPAHPHHCLSKCHIGNCPPCNKQTAVKCRCGHMDQMIKCRQLSTRADDARCKKRCTKKRSCGKHKCNQECCIDIDHICPMPCNYTLSCGKHKCDQPCHRGNCPPCYRSSFEELYCECGANVIYPPVPCGTKRPTCLQPCSRQHVCSHPVQHFCHSAPNCPPCIVLTTKWCFGQHEQRKTIPCNQESFSCGMACNKNLPCGRHKCIKPCHEGPCQIEGEICKQNCTTTRLVCGHKCNAPCHEGDCPETPCKEMVEVTCECGNRKQMRTCHDFSRDYRRIATAALASSMAEMQRGNNVELSDIMGPIKMTSNKTLECTEECRVLERNRRLAIGLQIRNPDTAQKLLTRYSDFIRSWAKKDPHLVKTIHNALTDLVKLAKESKQKSRRHSFPSMNREKRQLVHEMCGMFGVESEAYDAEPNRNVVATAYKERSWLPAMSIMDVMQRESGQRRVPVPNNNAWGIKK